MTLPSPSAPPLFLSFGGSSSSPSSSSSSDSSCDRLALADDRRQLLLRAGAAAADFRFDHAVSKKGTTIVSTTPVGLSRGPMGSKGNGSRSISVIFVFVFFACGVFIFFPLENL